jgi:Flp pilus assembly protein TadG
VDRPRERHRDERAAAVVDFVLVMVLLVPLLLGVLQLGLVLHVRNTLAAAASDGAHHGATIDRGPADAEARTRATIDEAVAGRYASDVSARRDSVDGVAGVVVEVRAEVPALGLFGPTVDLEVEGHAVAEVLP